MRSIKISKNAEKYLVEAVKYFERMQGIAKGMTLDNQQKGYMEIKEKLNLE